MRILTRLHPSLNADAGWTVGHRQLQSRMMEHNLSARIPGLGAVFDAVVNTGHSLIHLVDFWDVIVRHDPWGADAASQFGDGLVIVWSVVVFVQILAAPIVGWV